VVLARHFPPILTFSQWFDGEGVPMANDKAVDYYEVLQISSNADPDTIHRIYRHLAQRFHPDNQETGSDSRFRQVHEAYTVLSDPEQRARYDIVHQKARQDRFRLVATGGDVRNDFEMEQMVRLTLLEVLYTRRRTDPSAPAMFSGDLESLLGRPRELLEFTVWFLTQKKFVTRDDNSRLQITADGVEHLEQNYRVNNQQRRLKAANE
jgi:curved DNA-binding protein CbpA